MALMMTRIQVPDYDAWKPMFDQDAPGVRNEARGYRIRRGVEDPNEVFIQVEFDSVDAAREGREKLIASGVLDRFEDRTGPTIVEEAESKDLA